MEHSAPLVGIVMGSNSDWEVMKNAADMLDLMGIPFEARVVSAHRMPDEMFEYAETARDRGLKVIIAGAGGAAHLPGMIAAKCTLPVCGVPVPSKYLRGAVANTPEGREGMALAQYIAGQGFSNVGLGIVHSMAHSLGAVYDTPHGVANAILLPTIMEYNAPATGEKYVNYWVHGEFLILRSGKMSKSGGTFVTLDVLREKGYEPLAYRYLCLGAHYRTQLEFSYESMDSAAKSLKNLRALCSQVRTAAQNRAQQTDKSRAWKEKFTAAMEDDLNAPKALALAWEAVRNAELTPGEKLDFLQFADTILALDLFAQPEVSSEPLPEEVTRLLEERARARAAKDWKKSDELRDAIAQKGYVVKDTPKGQQTEKK